LQMQPLDLSQLARTAIEDLQPCAECKHITIDFKDASVPARVNGDRDALLQVLENLLSNAIKFSLAGKKVSVQIFVTDDAARVEVRDEGPGISADDQPKLFGKYVTLSARPTANEPSNGLGLSIAKNLVESMGGSIRCDSPPGQGARFSVEFRLAA